MKYCVKFNDREICVPIAYDPWWWLKHPLEKFKPQPDPWIEDSWLKPEVRENLATLAEINQLAKTLSPELQKTIGNSVQESLRQLPFPEGVSIEF
jgi:hypothetical protein